MKSVGNRIFKEAYTSGTMKKRREVMVFDCSDPDSNLQTVYTIKVVWNEKRAITGETTVSLEMRTSSQDFLVTKKTFLVDGKDPITAFGKAHVLAKKVALKDKNWKHRFKYAITSFFRKETKSC